MYALRFTLINTIFYYYAPEDIEVSKARSESITNDEKFLATEGRLTFMKGFTKNLTQLF